MTVRVAAAVGLVGAALALALVGLLHVIDADGVDPVRRTISEYALRDHGWLFDTGVLALAVGSVAVLIALVQADLVRWPSFAAVGMIVWAVGMGAVVAFEKTNWSVGPSVDGVIHRYASLVAFLALPIATLAATRGRDGAARPRLLAIAALAWLGATLYGVVLRPFTGVPWWQFVPLGIMERGLALTEVAVVIALAFWARSDEATVGRRDRPQRFSAPSEPR
ncbi:MAG: DUF998 domain-containing protein [Pseudonocardia sp.]|nr:DUF998 domain-containing protein [Pseudonocardia sp.]